VTTPNNEDLRKKQMFCPDYAFVLRRGSAVPMLVAADWIHHASRVVSLPIAQPASAERVA
jgi:hypothetical protein